MNIVAWLGHSALKIVSLALAGIFLSGIPALSAEAKDPQSPETSLPINIAGKTINKWVVLGPFNIPGASADDVVKNLHIGLEHDYLTSLDGEAKAVINTDQKFESKEAKVASGVITPRLITAGMEGDCPLVWFNYIFTGEGSESTPDFSVAYVFSYIDSDQNQKCSFSFGADDYARIWINGKLVLDKTNQTDMDTLERLVSADLVKGRNTVLIKVVNGHWNWGYSFDSTSKQRYEKMLADRRALNDMNNFMGMGIVPKDRWKYTFPAGTVPEICWENPELAKSVAGNSDLKIRWFNSKAEEVKVPKEPGRYAVIAEGAMKDGTLIRRALTLYASTRDWVPWDHNVKITVDPIPGSPIDPAVWKEHQAEVQQVMGNAVVSSFFNTPDGAILEAYLTEQKPSGKTPSKLDNATIANDEFQLAVKRKLIGADGKYKPLLLPHKKDGASATILHTGTLEEAGFKPDMPDKVRAFCQSWYNETKEPFTICIARHGIITMHESFGTDNGQPISVDQPMEMASITKAMTGMLLGQFLDQGLLNLDDPVGKYLPYFPTRGDKAITIRECLSHTAGLWGHYEWGGMHNPWLDNVVADGLPVIQPGVRHQYCGMGYDLLGKVMEVISGKNIFRLFQENFFIPLGANSITNDDLACATQCSAEDLARIGQLFLNRGSYGETEFFTPGTYEKMLPQKIEKYCPKIKGLEWGVGMIYCRSDFRTDSGQNGVPKDSLILSPNTIGHGASSGSIYRVDLDNDLVIAQARNNPSSHYASYLPRFLQVVADGLIK